jgi:hypothetical protein
LTDAAFAACEFTIESVGTIQPSSVVREHDRERHFGGSDVRKAAQMSAKKFAIDPQPGTS